MLDDAATRAEECECTTNNNMQVHKICRSSPDGPCETIVNGRACLLLQHDSWFLGCERDQNCMYEAILWPAETPGRLPLSKDLDLTASEDV